MSNMVCSLFLLASGNARYVLLNSSNAIELDFLNPDICGVDYGIDACMWIGDVGQTGINGVGQLLSGAVSPSGLAVACSAANEARCSDRVGGGAGIPPLLI